MGFVCIYITTHNIYYIFQIMKYIDRIIQDNLNRGLTNKTSYTSKSHIKGSRSYCREKVEGFPFKMNTGLENDLYPPPANWKKISNQVKKRDGYTCKSCISKIGLTVHHIKSRKDGGSDEMRNLITLCSCCHDKIEVENVQSWNKINGYKKRYGKEEENQETQEKEDK